MAVTFTALATASTNAFSYRVVFDGTTGTGTSATRTNAQIMSDLAAGQLKTAWTGTQADSDTARVNLMAFSPNGTITFPLPYQGISPVVDVTVDGSNLPQLVVDFVLAGSTASKAFVTIYTFK